jgi:DNA polymerase I
MLGFPQVWCVDFEFGTGPTGRPIVHCMVARELHSGREFRLWYNELTALGKAPFDIGPNSLFVAYSAGAEIGCFIELHWSIPLNILDVYAEYLAITNGHRNKKSPAGLLQAMEHYRLGHLAPAEKENMRALAIRGGPYTPQEQSNLLDYCTEDVDALCRLLPAMEPELAAFPAAEWQFRGAFMAAIQCVAQNGVPLDAEMLEAIRTHRLEIIRRMAEQLERKHRFEVYDGTHFRHAGFRQLTRSWGIRWPSTPSGLPSTADEVFREMIDKHPTLPIRPLYECRHTIELLQKFEIGAGPDGYSRCWLAPFRSESGRNQPSNTRFIFGAPAWMRHLIKPPEGHGVAYLDWSAQEIAIAGGLSGDARLIEDYLTGDIYTMIATRIGLAPPGASVEEARQIHASLARAYPKFHVWRQTIINGATQPRVYRTILGWPWWSGNCKNPRTIMNHPAQSNGSDMMRLATIAAVEAGLTISAPVHDAFLIAAPLERLDEDIASMLEIMHKAGMRIAGIPVGAACEVVTRWPLRFRPGRGEETWELVQHSLKEIALGGEGGYL